MSKIKNLFFSSFFLFGIISLSAFSQSVKQFIKEADKRFADGDYYGAAAHYGTVLSMDSTLMPVAYRCAESYRLYNEYRLAEQWYQKVFNADKKDEYPLSMFWLAMMQKSNGKYKEAKKLFEKYYRKNKKQSSYYTLKARQEIISCEFAMTEQWDSAAVTVQHLDTNINSVFSDFAAFQQDSILYFSSLRTDTGSTVYTGNYYSEIYRATRQDSLWRYLRKMDTTFNAEGSFNGNIVFNTAGTKCFFTRCRTSEKQDLQCSLFASELKNGKWTLPHKINNGINIDGYTSTQPSVGKDSSGRELLFFVSNRPGGKGNLDIWQSVISQNGDFEKPENANSPVNSIDDEITPFYHSETNTLYFSSNWHKGFGGFDIFKTNRDSSGKHWNEPENTGLPLNSRYNDLYFTMNPDKRSGFFTSNRIGSLFVQGETCCNDIFSYLFPKQDTVVVKEPPKVNIEKAIKLLVPLTLYFHNDEPDAKTMNTLTQKNYKTAFDEYLAMSEKYKDEYSKGLTETDKEKAVDDIAGFFEDSVTNGFQNLEKFAVLLLENLKAKKLCTVTLKGYCSPLASTEYNINLAKRRISSLRNYFNEYGNGILKQYMVSFEDTSGTSALLIFKEEEIGELQANPEVSDNPNDLKNSIYSRKAALERKIQIIAISTENSN